MSPLAIGLIFIGIVVLANLAAFAWASGVRNSDWKFWTKFESALRHPYKKEDDSLEELHRRVSDLSDKKDR